MPLPEIIEVRIGGKPQRLFDATPTRVVIQIPSDMPDTDGWPEFILKEQRGGPFDSALIGRHPLSIRDFLPEFLIQDGILAALHEDFSGLVSLQRPAAQGEVVHLYGVGFGAVSPPVERGSVAPASPLSRVRDQMSCQIILRGTLQDWEYQPLNVRFAGLAPGLIDTYQIDVQLPGYLPDGSHTVQCGRSLDWARGLLHTKATPR